MGANGRHDGMTLPEPLDTMQQRGAVLLIFLRHFG